jgi:hypothetical protein
MTIPINITRPKGTNRYQFSIRINGKKINQSFSFQEYGGEEKALIAAIEYKQKIYDENGLTIIGRGSKGPIKGVSRTSSVRNGNVEEYWQAVWKNSQGKQETRRFSIFTYGEISAKQKAVAARQDALKALMEGSDPRFIQPVTKYSKLWRYMDFTKFLSMLEDSSIFFSRANYFEDPFEGEIPKGNISLNSFVKSKSKSSRLLLPVAADKKNIMISCWHISSYESAAMWKLYGNGNEAICVTTKYLKLKNQLIKGANIGLVQYINHNRAWVPENNIYYPFMFKRKSFEHEKEVRALIDSEKISETDSIYLNEYGFKNRVDLNILIDEIYVDPTASDWFFELVKKVVNKYGIKARVIKSPLYKSPESDEKPIT